MNIITQDTEVPLFIIIDWLQDLALSKSVLITQESTVQAITLKEVARTLLTNPDVLLPYYKD
jgi:hypothetical protein